MTPPGAKGYSVPPLSLLRKTKEALFLQSLKAAGREQGLAPVVERLVALGAAPEEQYTTHRIDTDYLRLKVLQQQAFQLSFAGPELPADDGLVVDIGDSSGAHIQHLKALYPDCRARFLSVNLDPVAVRKIEAKGLQAMLGRAEDLASQGVRADTFLLFETLEHMPDPFDFLHDLAEKSSCRRLVLTVPYVRKSRLGLHHIRAGLRKRVCAENVHLLELCPADLRLLFQHTGWKVERERIYWQYPRRSLLRPVQAAWAKWDFEGFYGAALSRDDSWSSLYESWPNGANAES